MKCVRSAQPVPAAHGGATLTEVLMSILVMGIGVLSVISLFPASFLRTMQATNLTQSTILRYNADSLIDLDPINRLSVYRYWAPGTAYAVGDIVLARISPGPGNNRRFVCTVAGTSDAADPGWDPTVGNTTTEVGGVQWRCEDHSHYIIDPLGWNVVGAAVPAFQNAFGNDNTAPYPATPLERFNAAAATLPFAESLVTLPDSWVQQAQAIPSAFTASTVDLPAAVDLTAISTANPVSRVVLSDITNVTGRTSFTRIITGIAGQQISWDAAFPLPAGFTPTEVRVETQERRYTWLLTVRRSLEGVPSVDVTVFFRRALSPTDERVFTVAAINNATREVTIAHNLDGTAPAAKKGGFLLDVDNARWYRIQDSIAWNANSTRVTLDRSPIDAIVNVVVPRGIVDVYPIGSK